MAQTYYVKNGGNDALSGLDDANAWETLAKCKSKGDNNTFLLKCGSTWTGEQLDLSGKDNIVVSSYSTGNKPIIDVNLAYNDGIYFYGDNFTCSNVVVKQAARYGIHFGSYSLPHSTCVIHDCEAILNAQSGIRLHGDNITIYNCNATYNGNHDTPGIQLWQGENCLAYDNVSSYNYGSGIEINHITSGVIRGNYGVDNEDQFIEFWGTSDVLAYNNFGQNSGQNIYKITNGSINNILLNNIGVVSTTTANGIWIGYSGETAYCSENKIYNNTFYMTTSDATEGCLGVRAVGHKNNKFKNNIVYTVSKPAIYVKDADNTFDYNCYYKSSGTTIIWLTNSYTSAQFSTYQSASGQDANSIAQDPLLTSAYKLTKDSPCVDAGETLSEVTDDYEGTPRPIGTSSDIGAYEYYSKKICNAEIKNI